MTKASKAKRLKASKGHTKKSLADMFPVTKSGPPVEPLKLSRRPGFRRNTAPSFAAQFPVDETTRRCVSA